jgi:hypothetical protein
MSNTQELWRSVVGWEDLYEVSNLGRVRSIVRVLPNWRGGVRRYGGKQLKPIRRYDGYLVVNLSNAGVRRTVGIHQLVLEAFVGPCPHGFDACHNDGSRDDNQACNLRWDTRRNNMLDKHRHGTMLQGEQLHHARLTVEEVRMIRASDLGVAQLAKIIGVSTGAVRAAKDRRSWRHIT